MAHRKGMQDPNIKAESASQAFSLEPIGVFRSHISQKYDAPHQSNITQKISEQENNDAAVHLFPHQNFEQALSDVQGFERLWLVYLFHQNFRNGTPQWKPKVLPPRGRVKRGVFATRAPYRPNPLGISVVRLLSVQGLVLHLGDCDLLDGTPIFDIKPYIPHYDSFPNSATGWLEDLNQEPFTCEYAPEASLQLASALQIHPALDSTLRRVLALDPFPHPYRRIRTHNAAKGEFEYAYQTWRIFYRIDEDRRQILITSLHDVAK